MPRRSRKHGAMADEELLNAAPSAAPAAFAAPSRSAASSSVSSRQPKAAAKKSEVREKERHYWEIT